MLHCFGGEECEDDDALGVCGSILGGPRCFVCNVFVCDHVYMHINVLYLCELCAHGLLGTDLQPHYSIYFRLHPLTMYLEFALNISSDDDFLLTHLCPGQIFI